METDAVSKTWLEKAKKYINREKVKEYIENDDFNSIFKDLSSKQYPLNDKLTAALVAIFDDCGIDWLSHIKEIPAFAYDCSNIKSFVVPSNIEVILRCAFYNCRNLETLVIPESVVEIKDNMISKSHKAEIYYQGTKEQFKQIDGYTLLFKYSPGVEVHCSDGDLKQIIL